MEEGPLRDLKRGWSSGGEKPNPMSMSRSFRPYGERITRGPSVSIGGFRYRSWMTKTKMALWN